MRTPTSRLNSVENYVEQITCWRVITQGIRPVECFTSVLPYHVRTPVLHFRCPAHFVSSRNTNISERVFSCTVRVQNVLRKIAASSCNVKWILILSVSIVLAQDLSPAKVKSHVFWILIKVFASEPDKEEPGGMHFFNYRCILQVISAQARHVFAPELSGSRKFSTGSFHLIFP